MEGGPTVYRMRQLIFYVTILQLSKNIYITTKCWSYNKVVTFLDGKFQLLSYDVHHAGNSF